MDSLPSDLISIIQWYSDEKFVKQTRVLNRHWFKALKCYSYTIRLANNTRLKEAVSKLEQKQWQFAFALRKSVRPDSQHVALIANLTQITSLDFGELFIDRDTMHRFTVLTNLREIKSPVVAAVAAANPRLKSVRLGSSVMIDRELLKQCTNLERLSLEGKGMHESHRVMYDLSTQLTHLSIEYFDQATNIDLTPFTKLKSLRIAYLPTNIKIGTLTNLDWLSIEGHYMLLDSVSMLTNLTYLRMDVAPNGESYGGLQLMTKLEVLKLRESVISIDGFFAHLKKLRVFEGLQWIISSHALRSMNADTLEELAYYPHHDGVHDLGRFTNLRKLSIGVNEVLEDWSALIRLPYLTSISTRMKGDSSVELTAMRMTQLKVWKTRGLLTEEFEGALEYIRGNQGGLGTPDLTKLTSLKRVAAHIDEKHYGDVITYLGTLHLTALTNTAVNKSDLFWSTLQKMTDLVHLTIKGNEAEQLCLLTSLTNLTRLKIRNSEPLTGEYISKLTQLQELAFKCSLSKEAQQKLDSMPLLYKYYKEALF